MNLRRGPCRAGSGGRLNAAPLSGLERTTYDDHETILQTFDFAGIELRVIMHMAEPWLVATDVRRVLGIKQPGSNFAFLDKAEVKPLGRGLASGKGMSQALVLSESGLYKLIMRSDKPEAAKFQGWVTRDVLPSIRKTGGYLLIEQARETASWPELDGFGRIRLPLTVGGAPYTGHWEQPQLGRAQSDIHSR